MAAPQKKSVVPAPVKKKTLNRAPLWLASHKKKKKVVESPIKSPPPQREWSPIAGLIYAAGVARQGRQGDYGCGPEEAAEAARKRRPRSSRRRRRRRPTPT